MYTDNLAMKKQDAPLLNFFCSIELLSPLLMVERDFQKVDTKDFTMDLIEVPYQIKFTSDVENLYFKAYTRYGLYKPGGDDTFECGSLTVNKTTGEGSGQINSTTSIESVFEQIVHASQTLGCLIAEKGWDKTYAGLDPMEKGLLLSYENDDFNVKVVSGKERPDLMCQLMFGMTELCRPYFEDFMENSKYEMMVPEEMIQAAENGDEVAMQRLAMAYLKGENGLEANGEKAVYWNKRLAEAGDPIGMFNLGLHTAKGYGTPRDFIKAAEWMEKAASAGDPDACAPAEEYRRMADNLKKAETGDAQAQADLAGGYMTLGGSLNEAGPEDDYKECLKWANKSANQDNGDGLWILALAYEHGRGVVQDKKKAVELYKKGAEMGHAKCQHSLGCYYIRGEITPKDEKKAFELFEQSAEKGYGLAMKALGNCYQFGTGTNYDMNKAIEWYEKSLEVFYDPELAKKVSAFKFLGKLDEGIDDGLYASLYRKPDPDEAIPVFTFNLTFTKKGDRKERSNRLKIGDKVRFELTSDGSRLNAVTNLGDIGDIDARCCWITEVLKNNVHYDAKISKLISYNQLDNKKKNPVIEISFDLNMKWADAEKAIGWKYMPDGIFYYDKFERQAEAVENKVASETHSGDTFDKAASDALNKLSDSMAVSMETAESESRTTENEIDQINREINECEEEIVKINDQLEKFKNKDKTGISIAEKIKKENDKIYRDYYRDITDTQNLIQSSVFTGVNDPLLKRYINIMRNTVNTYGNNAEKLVADSILELNNKASSISADSVVAIIKELVKVIDDVEGNNVSFSALGLNLNYKFRAGSDYMKSKLQQTKNEFVETSKSENKDIKNLKKVKEDKTAECNNLRKRVEDLKDAVKYSIPVDDVDKHRKYLHALKAMESVKHSNDLIPVKKELGEISDYLDSKAHLEKCKELEAEFLQREEDEYNAELAAWNDKVKEIEENIAAYEKECDEEEAKVISALQSEHDASELEMNNELSQTKDNLQKYNEELNNLGIFKFGRKKELTSLILEAEEQISVLENKIKEEAKNTEDMIASFNFEYKNRKEEYGFEMRKKMPKKPQKK